MKFEIIDNINKFLEIESKWNNLYFSDDYTFFQSFNYNFYSWKNILFKDSLNTLNIILVSQKNTLVAICPFYIDKLKRLRFINDIHTDFCDILLVEEFELSKIINSFNQIKSISLINVTKESNIQKVLNLDQYNYIHKYQSFFSYINLKKGEFPQNHSILRSKQKSEFRRIAKKHTDSIHLILSINNSDFPINQINTLRNKMIKSKVRRKSFLDSNFLKLIQSLYAKNELIISIIKNGSCIKAISFILKKDNNYLFWVDMYDHSKMINIFNYIKFISAKSFRKDVNVHFGRGDYLYKLNNFKPKIENLLHINIFFRNLDLLYFKVKFKILNLIRKTYRIIFR